MKVVNVIIAGIGGQGVLMASDILAHAVYLSGFDVKKSEIHGMSQRGGSVTSDVRFGDTVWSPMVPWGESDFLVVLEPDQTALNRPRLKSAGVLIEPGSVPTTALPNAKCLNVALLGLLSRRLPMIPAPCWHEALKAHVPAAVLDMNLQVFEALRNAP